MNVLIIEHDQTCAQSLISTIEGLGLGAIAIASNGAQAKALYEATYFDVVFCDITLPDVNSIDVLADLCKYTLPKSVAIISALDKDILDLTYNICVSAGVHHVNLLKKPLKRQEVARIIRDVATSNTIERIENRIILTKADIEQAFDENHFINYYQPKVSTQTGEIDGVEVLVRLWHPKYGVLSPHYFLNTLMFHGFSYPLFHHVLQGCLRDLGPYPNLKIAINVDQEVLRHPVYKMVTQLCEQHHVSPQRITIELTEHDVYDSEVPLLVNLAKLKLSGVKLSIDDFGTGYSSFSKLALLPFTELKLDRAFIKDFIFNDKSKKIVESIVLLAKSLSMTTVAEGVEDNTTLQSLIALGVDYYQGYFSYQPLSIDELKAVIE
ncbi:EAL domain-containing response regulator [Vibrio harveyi]|nr:EAL domain-containing response regulator [Vibrio harveyi]